MESERPDMSVVPLPLWAMPCINNGRYALMMGFKRPTRCFTRKNCNIKSGQTWSQDDQSDCYSHDRVQIWESEHWRTLMFGTTCTVTILSICVYGLKYWRGSQFCVTKWTIKRFISLFASSLKERSGITPLLWSCIDVHVVEEKYRFGKSILSWIEDELLWAYIYLNLWVIGFYYFRKRSKSPPSRRFSNKNLFARFSSTLWCVSLAILAILWRIFVLNS